MEGRVGEFVQRGFPGLGAGQAVSQLCPFPYGEISGGRGVSGGRRGGWEAGPGRGADISPQTASLVSKTRCS